MLERVTLLQVPNRSHRYMQLFHTPNHSASFAFAPPSIYDILLPLIPPYPPYHLSEIKLFEDQGGGKSRNKIAKLLREGRNVDLASDELSGAMEVKEQSGLSFEGVGELRDLVEEKEMVLEEANGKRRPWNRSGTRKD